VGSEELINERFFIKICLISIITINWQKEKFHRKTREDILTAHCHAVFFTYNKAATDNYCKDISIFTFSNCHHLEWKGLSQF
jgi:hypothetical protein